MDTSRLGGSTRKFLGVVTIFPIVQGWVTALVTCLSELIQVCPENQATSLTVSVIKKTVLKGTTLEVTGN